MDYMFKDIEEILSISMFSDKNAKITSMISSFENTRSLEKLSINGFDTSQVKSLNKFLYKSSLKQNDFKNIQIDISNVEDLSYMFAEILSENMDLTSLNTTSVKNMSHLFYNCL